MESTQSKLIKELIKIFIKKIFLLKLRKQMSLISTNDVINTNNCLISMSVNPNIRIKLLLLSSIDNLIKGGAGQAIQNLKYQI